MSESSTIGIDLGGTKIAAGLVDSDGDVLDRYCAATPAQSGPDAIIAAVVGLVECLRGAAVESGMPSPRAVGIGAAGVINPFTGTVVSATDHLPGWAGTELTQRIRTSTGLPTRAVNDVHAHAIGEARYGAGIGARTMLLIAVGTGLGGSLVVDGTPVIGSRFVAGHLGHVPSREADGLPCRCGRIGHLEAIASGPGLVDSYRRRGGEVSDARELVAFAESGDAVARACVETSARALGEAIGGWVNMLDPDIVVLSGGLAASGPLWWSHVTNAARSQFIDAVADCSIVAAQRGSDAALAGAAAIAGELL